jgi:hypothetical protein
MNRVTRGVLRTLVWISLLSLGILVPVAHADKDQPCAEDMQKFCETVAPGGGRILACLRAREDQLTPTCRQRVTQFEKEIAGLEVCLDDLRQFCPTPGRGGVVGCLRENEGKLSPPCRAAVKKASPGGSQGRRPQY